MKCGTFDIAKSQVSIREKAEMKKSEAHSMLGQKSGPAVAEPADDSFVYQLKDLGQWLCITNHKPGFIAFQSKLNS